MSSKAPRGIETDTCLAICEGKLEQGYRSFVFEPSKQVDGHATQTGVEPYRRAPQLGRKQTRIRRRPKRSRGHSRGHGLTRRPIVIPT